MIRLIISFLIASLFAVTGCQSGQHPSTKQPEKEKSRPVFTEQTACVLAELAYCDTAHQLTGKYLPGWTVVWDGRDTGGNYAFVAHDGYNYAVAIRGSLMSFTEDALNNWLYQDMNVLHQKDWNYTDSVTGAVVSRGVYDGWRNLDNMREKTKGSLLTDFLLTLDPGKTPVHFSGHSLGGNIATVYASYMHNRYKEKQKNTLLMNVITFAAPAAGNAAFAADFNKKFPHSIRIENEHDIVPKFPCRNKIDELGSLFSKGPSAKEVSVSYRGISVSLADAFSLMSKALFLLKITGSDYEQTNGNGKRISIPLSGKNTGHDIGAWFDEAGYQHALIQYARFLNAPVVEECK